VGYTIPVRGYDVGEDGNKSEDDNEDAGSHGQAVLQQLAESVGPGIPFSPRWDSHLSGSFCNSHILCSSGYL
jgi:hypothetical protein